MKGHEKNILVNDNLPRFGTEIAQTRYLFLVKNVSLPDMYKSNINTNTFLNKYQQHKAHFTKVGKVLLDKKFTHFHSPFKLIHTGGKRVPLHLLEKVKTKLKRMEKEGHIIKLKKRDKEFLYKPQSHHFGTTSL